MFTQAVAQREKRPERLSARLSERVEYVLCDQAENKSVRNAKNRKFAPLDDGAIYKHLQGRSPNGTDVVGIYPLTEDEHCRFLAMDFGGSSWEDDVVAVRAVCKKNMKFLFSSSVPVPGLAVTFGFFFKEKVRAVFARKFGTLLLNGAMQMRHSIRFSAYDRLFPNPGLYAKGRVRQSHRTAFAGYGAGEGGTAFSSTKILFRIRINGKYFRAYRA